MASASPGGVRFNAESSESALLSALRVGDRLAYREAMRRFGGPMLAAAREARDVQAFQAILALTSRASGVDMGGCKGSTLRRQILTIGGAAGIANFDRGHAESVRIRGGICESNRTIYTRYDGVWFPYRSQLSRPMSAHRSPYGRSSITIS